MFTLGMELPLWKNKKQDLMISAATHDMESFRKELKDAEAQARADAYRLESQWQRDSRQIVRYKEAIIPQTSAAIDAAQSAYLSGMGDFSMLIENFNMWLEARVELAKRTADLFITWAELDQLISTVSSEQ
jgi:outer membrane protein TolC